VKLRRESLVWRLMMPPGFDEENSAAVAGGIYAIGWTLLLIATPLLLAFAWVVPVIAAPTLRIAIGLDVIAAGALAMTHYRRINAASLWLAVTSWLLFSWTVWTTGGLRSSAIVSLFVIVMLAGAVQNWRWGAVAAAAGIVTVGVMAWGSASGALPATAPKTDLAIGASYSAYFVALGVLQGFLAASVKRTRDRADREARQRRAAERRLLDVVDNAPFGAFVSESTPAGHLIVVHTNRAASEVLGMDATEFIGESVGHALWALSGDDVVVRFEEIARTGGNYDADSVPFHVGSRRGTLEMHAFQIAEGSMAVFFSDVTERRRTEVQIHRMAFHDELTKLPNRKLLLDRLGVALASAQRRGTHVALLFLDLDDFKLVNDRYGHGLGDELLVAVAERLTSCARATDTVARFGGDEFTILAPDLADERQVPIVAEKFAAAFGRPFAVGERSISVTASIGVSVADGADDDPAALLERADSAMYRVKRAGRNSYRIS
jgi:diguanylate cyclase (GGDEF)-like protein